MFFPDAGAYGVGPSQAMGWPKGCLGYAFNLVRPKMPGLRQKVLAAVLGSTLVFATLDEAADYRRLVTQVLLQS